jgi:F0F1-type ATP synthase membrane subunit b/b'
VPDGIDEEEVSAFIKRIISQKEAGLTPGFRERVEAEAKAIVKQAELKGHQIIEEAKKKAEAEARKIVAQAEQKGHQIVDEAENRAIPEANKAIAEAEQKKHQSTEEVRKKAEVEASKIVAQAEQKGRQITDEIKKTAEVEASKIVAQAEQKGRQIIDEAKRKAEAKAKVNKTIAEAEQRARKIVEEAERTAAAPSAQRPQLIIKAAKEQVVPEAKDKEKLQEAVYPKQGELLIIPPVDFAQLEKLQTSLQQSSNFHVLATSGSGDGSIKISIHMDKPVPLAESLRELGIIEEAIEEQTLESHSLGSFVRKALHTRLPKRHDEQRVLVLLKKAQ